MPAIEEPVVRSRSGITRRPLPLAPSEMRRRRRPTNIGGGERAMSLLGAVWLIRGALRHLFRGRFGTAAMGSTIGGLLAYRGATGHSRLYRAVGAVATGRSRRPFPQEICTCKSITIRKPSAELYEFCRNRENWRKLVPRAECIDGRDDHRSRWRIAGAPADSLEWEMQIVNEKPGQFFEWTASGPGFSCQGMTALWVAPGDRGTVVEVSMRYHSPGGAIAALLAKVFRCEPAHELHEALRRFKQLMEAGEIATNAGPSGRVALGCRPSRGRRRTSSGRTAQGEETAEDPVTVASMESFPASDSPAW